MFGGAYPDACFEIREAKDPYVPLVYVRVDRSGSLALLVTRAMVISGDRTPRASGQTDRGLGSQQRSLVRRGQRSTVAVRRDVPAWLAGDSPSGAEASSGPPDTCRSTGCGVEKATGIPPVGTPGNRGLHIHTVFILLSDAARRISWASSSLNFSWTRQQ